MQPLQWSFQPGPSQPYAFLRGLMAEAFDAGIISLLHRGPAFHTLYQRVHRGLVEKMGMPEDYTVLFFSSATEVWQVMEDCETLGPDRWHFVSDETGFGKRWETRTHQDHTLNTLWPNTPSLKLYTDFPLGDPDVLSFCSNETSNGQQIPLRRMLEICRTHPKALVAVDATSHLAADELPIAETDLLFASVQKGFGCPAGLAVLLVSPRAAERIERQPYNQATSPYNTLSGMLKWAKSWETGHTPNILGIYLLGRTLELIPPLQDELPRLHAQAQAYYAWADAHPVCNPLQTEAEWRSRTSICIECRPEILPRLHYAARQEGMELGKGYGQYKDTTFRIANFPALPTQAHHELLHFLTHTFNW